MSSPTSLDALIQRADRRQIVDLARAAARAGLHDERSRFAVALIRLVDSFERGQLTYAEHVLVREAWMAEIGPRRAACAALSDYPWSADDPLLPAFRAERDQDLAQRAGLWLSLLNERLIPSAGGEAEVEYFTWAGDLKTCLAERFPGAGHEADAVRSYAQAMDLAVSRLRPTHPIRLGLVLNYAVCTYEQLKEDEEAVAMLKRALDEAVGMLDRLEGAAQEEASALLKLIWDKHAAWTTPAG